MRVLVEIKPFVLNPNGGVSKRAKEVQVALSLPARGIAALEPIVEDLGAGHDEDTASFEVPLG